MMKSICLLVVALAAGATAFAPISHLSLTPASSTTTSTTSTALNEFCNGYVGNDGPEPMAPIFVTGSKNFDPAGFCERAPEWVPWFREAELKHGRMAMLGVAGLVAPEFFRVPGDAYSFAAIPNVIDGHDALPQAMIQIFGWISFMEAVSFPALANMNEFDRAPGDFGFDPLKLYPKTADKQKEMQIKELKNGRLAMIACGGMVAGALITGKGFPYL